MKEIFAILPNLCSESGHIYAYHRSFEKAALINGWKYHVYIPKKTRVKTVPNHWLATLANDWWEVKKSLFFRCKMLFMNILPFIHVLRASVRAGEGTVFLEHFELQNIASMFLATLICKPNCSFWILHRYAFGANHFKTKVYNLFHHFLIWRGAKVTLLTDSDLLAKEHKTYYRKRVGVLSIPHTKEIQDQEIRDYSLIWWPGTHFHPDKGFHIVKRVVESLRNQRVFSLVLADRCKKDFLEDDPILYIGNPLTSEQYSYWLSKVGFIFLPYCPTSYAHRTSGVFVETVVSGAIPIVSKGSWMAYELKKFSLDELAYDFTETNLLPNFSKLSASLEIKRKLLLMKMEYELLHSEKGLANLLARLDTKSDENENSSSPFNSAK